MSDNVLLVRPVAISAGSALVTYSNVAELTPTHDPDAWDPATAYVVGDQVGRATTHKVYQRRVDGTTATEPENDATNWAEVGVTNKWKPFDSSYQSQCSNDEEIVYQLTLAEFADTLTVLNCECATVRVQATDFDETKTMYTRTVEDWFDYFFEPFTYRADAAFLDLPMSTTDTITVTLSNPGGVAKVGEIKPGFSKAIGGARYGVRTGMVDYSRKVTDDWGNLTVTEGAYSKRMSLDVWVRNTLIDELHRLMYRYRATPIVLLGARDLYECLIAYGYIESFENAILYTNYSICSLEFRGLT